MFSTLIKRKITRERFRLPDCTASQAYAMLHTACRAEVHARHREFRAEEYWEKHLWEVAKWLTGNSSTFGLFLCGGVGNGKTTILKALQNLYNCLSPHVSGSNNSYGPPYRGFRFVMAKDLVQLAKAYNNPTRDNRNDAIEYNRIRNIEILAIDDLGLEPRESIHYGDYITPLTDIVSYRYEEQFCILASSNLGPRDIRDYYDDRIADRLYEMMEVVNFGCDPSFRRPPETQTKTQTKK